LGLGHISLYYAGGRRVSKKYRKVFETIGPRAKSEGKSRAGGEKHHGGAKTKMQSYNKSI
jgi:hypothetical protein